MNNNNTQNALGNQTPSLLGRLGEEIKAEAKRLGFFACGIAKAEPVDEDTQRRVRRWVAEKDYAGMEYMANNLEKRLDPTLLVPGTKSIISVALNYAPKIKQDNNVDKYHFSAYALGKDYHDIVKKRLRQLASKFGWEASPGPSKGGELKNTKLNTEDAKGSNKKSNTEDTNGSTNKVISNSPPLEGKGEASYRCFVDSAPVLERYWAVRAGLGWIGKSHSLIIPHAGTMFFLGEIFVNIELEYDKPTKNYCGRCTRCLDACPTHALATDPFDASLCLSYQLIENRGELSETAKEAMGDTIYGCDRCQQTCPWNRFATPTDDPEMQPSEAFLNMTKEDWQNLDIETYRKLFKGSAVKRVKYEGLMRNIKAAGEQD